MIEFDNAGFSYGRTDVLSDIDLTLEPGSFSVLTGPSGSGKTTFLRLCYRDLVPDSGQVRFFGKRIRRNNRNAIADLRRRVGVIHQHCRFLDHLPLLDNIALPLEVSGLDVRERLEDLQDLLGWVDLGGRLEAYPQELSGGERQRAAVARAVILGPEIILADEPTGNLDWDMALRILTLLVELNRMGKTVLFVTHDYNLIREAEARVEADLLVIEDGCILPAEEVA